MKICGLLFALYTLIPLCYGKEYCLPGDSCWPSDETFRQLETDNPELDVVLKGDPEWKAASNLVMNARVAKTPGVVAYATTVDHIKAVIKFTKDHNLNLKIISSGHEFIGRNIAEGAFLLSVFRMASITTDLNCEMNADGCMTVGPGVLWLAAYKEADAVNRIVVGGSEVTVSVTGWMLGGGHSPLTPTLGLGVDNVLEVEMVTANLSVVTMNKDGMTSVLADGTTVSSTDTDLFWAIRGGGGGTYGIVTSITYKMHLPPEKISRIICSFSTFEDDTKFYQNVHKAMRPLLIDLPRQFGGYILNNVLCYPIGPSCYWVKGALYALVHWGPVSSNQEYFDELKDTGDKLSDYLQSGPCSIVEYDTFLEYELTIANSTYTDADLFGTFLSPTDWSDEFIEDEADIWNCAFDKKQTVGATYTRLGGPDAQSANTSSGATAINPLFRNALFSVGGGTSEEKSPLISLYYNMVGNHVAERAQYYSECNDRLAPEQWQKQFWGETTYERLLSIKNKYDADNVFTCKQCVGSDSGSSDVSGWTNDTDYCNSGEVIRGLYTARVLIITYAFSLIML